MTAVRADFTASAREKAMIDPTAINILVLDDEPFMREVLLHMLGRLGFDRVAATDNGASALAMLAAAQPPNLILCDLNMPEMMASNSSANSASTTTGAA